VLEFFRAALIQTMAAEDETWFIIPCPSAMALTSICKERGTHGSVYCLWECERATPVWIGQSIPALVRCINDKAVYSVAKRLHASSLYRCLRKEARKESHKNWKVEKFSRAQVEDLNTFTGRYPGIIFVSKSPELWKCGDSPTAASDPFKQSELDPDPAPNVASALEAVPLAP
jgi:hypothetical protein